MSKTLALLLHCSIVALLSTGHTVLSVYTNKANYKKNKCAFIWKNVYYQVRKQKIFTY